MWVTARRSKARNRGPTIVRNSAKSHRTRSWVYVKASLPALTTYVNVLLLSLSLIILSSSASDSSAEEKRERGSERGNRRAERAEEERRGPGIPEPGLDPRPSPPKSSTAARPAIPFCFLRSSPRSFLFFSLFVAPLPLPFSFFFLFISPPFSTFPTRPRRQPLDPSSFSASSSSFSSSTSASSARFDEENAVGKTSRP